MIRSVADCIDAVIELVDLRYRPEVNTIGALVLHWLISSLN